MSHDSDLARLAAADPELDPDRRTAFDTTAVRERVHHQLATSTGTQRARPTRRRVALVAAVAGLMLATVTGGYAILAGGGASQITCASANGDAAVVVNALSPSPVADCLPHLDPDDPAAYGVYTDDAGTVVVAPDQETAQAVARTELRPAPGLALDTDRLELRMALDDVITGAHGCGDVAAVVDRAEQIVADLDMPNMPVVLREPEAANTSCAFAFIHPELAQITVATHPDDGQDLNSALLELREVSRTIHQQIDTQCLTADQAHRIVTDQPSGPVQDPTTKITVNTDPDAECARVYTNAYGVYEVTIFGP